MASAAALPSQAGQALGGRQRQYSGTAGKVANCQIGVSLSVATHTEQMPIDFEPYLPESFRRRVRKLGLHYAVGVDPRTKVWLLDPNTQLSAAKQDVKSLALELERRPAA